MWQKYKIQYILKVHVIGITRLESQKDNMKWEKAIFEEILDGQLKENRSTVSWSSANPQQNKCKENHTNTQIKLLKSTEKKSNLNTVTFGEAIDFKSIMAVRFVYISTKILEDRKLCG